MNRPYTYYLFWPSHNLGYIGVRTANTVSAHNDLWKNYKTSSHVVHKFIEEETNIPIINYWEHDTADQAIAHELELFRRLSNDVRRNCMMNVSFSHNLPNMTGYKHTDTARQNMSAAQKGRTFSTEHRRKLSEANRGRKMSEESKQKKSNALKGRSWSTARRAACTKKQRQIR